MSVARIALAVASILALIGALVVHDDEARAATAGILASTARSLAAPDARSPYISSPVGRELTLPSTTWDPAVVDDIRALARSTNSRGLYLLHGDDVVIDDAPEGRGPFAVASISKAISALAVARLVDEGGIGFDDHLADTIVAWRADDRAKIRVRDLLSHTSGLSSDLSTTTGPAGGPPSYHLAAYDVVPGVVAARSGMPFPQFVDEHLLKPAGGKGITWLKDKDGVAIASYGAKITIDDLAVLGKLMLNGGFTKEGEVLRARTLDEVTRAHGQYARGFGLGWFIHHATDNALQFDIVEARGASGHMVTVVPARQAVLVRIGSNGGDDGVPEQFHALLRRL
jgi:CubicO group peptidase (beta-lactamase class C family)